MFPLLLIFIPVTLASWFFDAPTSITFFASGLAIIPLAKYIGDATEELSLYSSPAVGGFLNATFGNATELIIGILGIQAGLLEVVKASLTGSIIGNLLLVLGAAIFCGGLKHKKQKFNATAVLASSSTLFLSIIALIIPAIFFQTFPQTRGIVIENMSLLVAAVMIVSYIASLLFSLHTHKHLYTEEIAELESGKWSLRKSIAVLSAATIGVSAMSEILIKTIEPMVSSFGWSEIFIGVIFIGIIGNAAEHSSAIIMAMKNRMDLSLQISIGSATQIAMFVAPILVLASLLFAHPMNLIFTTFELITIVLSVFMANLVTQDGESNWLEGLQLLLAYAIMAVGFFFYP